jgi:nitrate reductase NapAB chaperone NapD
MATTRAHLLLQAEPGRAAEVVRHVATVAEVREVTATSGPFDVIAVVDVEREGDLARALGRVRRAPGLVALRVCRAGAVTAA